MALLRQREARRTMGDKRFDVVGIGNAIVDAIVFRFPAAAAIKTVVASLMFTNAGSL